MSELANKISGLEMKGFILFCELLLGRKVSKNNHKIKSVKKIPVSNNSWKIVLCELEKLSFPNILKAASCHVPSPKPNKKSIA